MMFVGQMATTIYLPGLPDIARDLGTSLSSAQTLVPAYLAIFALAQLIVGPLSDRLGRRPVIVSAIGVFTLASLACALAPDIVTLLLARFAQAAGACATIVVSRAMVRDTSTGVAAAQAMSYLAIALGVGPATAPFIGGFLTTGFGWQSTFIATALVGAGVLVCVIALLNETLPREMRNPPPASELLRDYLQLLRNRPFVVYGLTMAFTAAAAATYLTSIPIVFIVLMDVSPEMLGMFIMIMPPLFMMATYISRRLSNRISLDRLILIGVFISASGGLLQFIFGLMQVSSPYPVMLAFGVSNFGTGFVFANCLAQALNTVPPAIAGSASGLSGFMHIGWGAVVSLAVASMIHTSSLQLGIAQLATTWLALASALFLYYAVKRRPA